MGGAEGKIETPCLRGRPQSIQKDKRKKSCKALGGFKRKSRRVKGHLQGSPHNDSRSVADHLIQKKGPPYIRGLRKTMKRGKKWGRVSQKYPCCENIEVIPMNLGPREGS